MSAHFVGSTIIECVICRKNIGVILPGLRGSFHKHIPTQHTASFSIDNGQDVDFVFFSPMKVNNSFNSAFLTLTGNCAFESLVM